MSMKKTLVILGGGLAGLPLALHIEKHKKLSRRLNVIMIDRKDYFEMNCESVRFLVKPDTYSRFVAPYSKYLKSTQFMCATIHAVNGQHVVVSRDDDSESEFIPFDYLVVAIGTKKRYEYFKASKSTIGERGEELQAFAQRVKTANRILIVGGRTVGVEFMGEVLNEYPEKEVFIVHSGKTLLDEWGSTASEMINKHLKNKRLTRKVEKSEGNIHFLNDGTTVEADLKVVATGVVPNVEPLHPFFDDALSKNKCLRVQPSLQVEGHNNVFAIGDIVDLKIPKLAANIRKQKKVIVNNLEALVFGKEMKKGLKSSKLQEISLVSLGPSYH